jgi:hypothetical protein
VRAGATRSSSGSGLSQSTDALEYSRFFIGGSGGIQRLLQNHGS